MSFIENGNKVAQFIADTAAFLGALLYIFSIILALVGCDGICTGTDLDAWMPAFFFFPIGMPLVVRLIKRLKSKMI